MSSSEEYLDNLLKSLTEGANSAGVSAVSPAMQDIAEPDGLQDTSVAEEADKTMSMDDIEAMFASMGVEPSAEDVQGEEDVSSDGEMLSEEPVPDDTVLSDELSADAGLLSDELILDEGTLSDELLIDADASSGIVLSDDLALEESAGDDLSFEGLGLGEETLPDELAPDDGVISDELVLDDGMISDELVPDNGMVSDELVPDDGVISDELVLDDGMISDELFLDNGIVSDELVPDDGVISDELVPDDETVSDELVLDDSAASDELVLDDNILTDELLLGDSMEADDGGLSDEPVLDDSILTDELLLGDVDAADDLVQSDEAVSDDFALEESAGDELSLEELGLGDLGLEELGLEERDQEAPEGEEAFALEEESEIEEAFALEEGEVDEDLSALLASMGGNEDLSEINDLLEKSDQGVAIDDDMMAMLDSLSEGEEGEEDFDFFAGEEGEGEPSAEESRPEDIREITPEELSERENPKSDKQKKKEEKERKKREKKEKKEKKGKKAKKKGASQDENAGGENADDLSGLLEGVSEGEVKPKKQGFFGKLIDILLEDDEEQENPDADPGDVGVVIGNLSDENRELLAELKAEDKKNAKKKDKKDKQNKKEKKDKKDKKGKKKGPEAGAEGEEGEAKPKKPKKEKKKKKEEDIEEELKLPGKKLSKKKVVSVFLFCATIAACIIVLTMLLPEQMEKQEARLAYDNSQYDQVYDLLYGKELNEEDEVLFQKSSVVLKMQRKLDSFENYRKMNMQLEALNALIEGVNRYQFLRDQAYEYNVGDAVAGIYGQILDELANNYGLSEADALDIISSGDNVTYSQRLQAVISGDFHRPEEEESVPEGKQDILPEEEEIIDRLQGTETE